VLLPPPPVEAEGHPWHRSSCSPPCQRKGFANGRQEGRAAAGAGARPEEQGQGKGGPGSAGRAAARRQGPVRLQGWCNYDY
jgi:hypothetical protein